MKLLLDWECSYLCNLVLNRNGYLINCALGNLLTRRLPLLTLAYKPYYLNLAQNSKFNFTR